jgi:hypothetical protein
MLNALYYPHTDITSEVILKNALILWDGVETIVPHDGWQPHRFPDKVSNEAVDLVVSSRRPGPLEKSEAHSALENLRDSGELAKILAQGASGPARDPYRIYDEKFMRSTWYRLEERGIAQRSPDGYTQGVPPEIGFLMMSLLADACAGTQLQKITDRGDAYSWLAESRARAFGTTYVRGFDISQVAPAHDRLVSLSLGVLDARNVSLSRLVALRKKELRTGGAHYSAMRRRYSNALQAHLKRICAEARSKTDVRELERQFKSDLADDLDELKGELRLASIKTLFSKEVAMSAFLGAGAMISPISGLTELASKVGFLGVLPLVKAAVELRGARRAALSKHTNSWLYLATEPRAIQVM